jgi:hypothetical protein
MPTLIKGIKNNNLEKLHYKAKIRVLKKMKNHPNLPNSQKVPKGSKNILIIKQPTIIIRKKYAFFLQNPPTLKKMDKYG